jgi:UDP-N-acetylglucosamine 2-epimerase (non-hydrolysing)
LRPVAVALAARGVTPSLVFTGQHPGLKADDFGLRGFPAVDLNCPGQEDPHKHVGVVTSAFLPELRNAPDLVVVQGDTSSALGAALASFTAAVPVAHVEAGLRTHDPMLPWPEEEYRTAIDADADLLFAPTELAAGNLRSEQVPGEIHVTGNTGIDAVLEAASRLPPKRERRDATARILVTCHRRESWFSGLKSIAAAVIDLATGGAEVLVVLHPNPFVASKMQRLLAGKPGVRLIEPCSHDELLKRMHEADLVLSDSGGIQEEAPAIGVPLLVLRDKTERPEGIAAGTALLVGTDRRTIVAEARRILADPLVRAGMSRQAFPYGDGRAGPRIAEVIDHWLMGRSVERRLA